jgi:hypothetical protein
VGRGTNCSLYKLFLYLGNVATVRPNPTLNLVLETILVFLGHQSFQGGSKGGGEGGLGESWEGSSSCTCNPCEGALKQIGSCKAKFGPTHHVYNNPTPSPISHFNLALPESNFGLLSCMLTFYFTIILYPTFSNILGVIEMHSRIFLLFNGLSHLSWIVLLPTYSPHLRLGKFGIINYTNYTNQFN